MNWKLVTDAASEPITTAQAKTHCRIDTDTDDTYIDILIKTARQQVEEDTDRAMLTQTWEIYMDSFPASDSTPIRFPRSPLIAVSSVAYTDTAGDAQTWSADEYDVDINTEPGRLLPAYGYTYPSTYDKPSNVIIAYTCGYGVDIGEATLLPQGTLMATYLLISHGYEHREAVEEVSGRFALRTIPLGYYSYIDKCKVGWEW